MCVCVCEREIEKKREQERWMEKEERNCFNFRAYLLKWTLMFICVFNGVLMRVGNHRDVTFNVAIR